jgi:hypothetical protein
MTGGAVTRGAVPPAPSINVQSQAARMPTSKPLSILLPGQHRRIPTSFAWLDHRLRTPPYLGRMTPEEIGLYVFLALAADRHGLSCWRLDRVERAMPCWDVPALARARRGLVDLGLIAFKPWSARDPDGIYQLLALDAPVARTVARAGEPVSLSSLLVQRLEPLEP